MKFDVEGSMRSFGNWNTGLVCMCMGRVSGGQ